MLPPVEKYEKKMSSIKNHVPGDANRIFMVPKRLNQRRIPRRNEKSGFYHSGSAMKTPAKSRSQLSLRIKERAD